MIGSRFLVTGGAGFIGKRLTRELVNGGALVTVLDDFSAGGTTSGIPSEAVLVRGDVCSLELLQNLTAGQDGVFHLAACVSVKNSILNWRAAHDVNLGGTMTVLEAARQAGNVPVIYASSAAVYGNVFSGRNDETMLPQPISPYAADKLACEHQAAAMFATFGVPSIGLRFFNVYGPGQRADSPYSGVISRFVFNKLHGSGHDIFGDGRQSRDFIHVDDIVKGMVLAFQYVSKKPYPGVFNLCTGTETTLLEVVGILDQVADGVCSTVRFHPPRKGDVRRSLGSCKAAKAALGFSPKTSLHLGLTQLWQHAGM